MFSLSIESACKGKGSSNECSFNLTEADVKQSIQASTKLKGVPGDPCERQARFTQLVCGPSCVAGKSPDNGVVFSMHSFFRSQELKILHSSATLCILRECCHLTKKTKMAVNGQSCQLNDIAVDDDSNIVRYCLPFLQGQVHSIECRRISEQTSTSHQDQEAAKQDNERGSRSYTCRNHGGDVRMLGVIYGRYETLVCLSLK